MTTEREALEAAQQALEAFTDPEGNPPEDTGEWRDAMKALAKIEAALAESERRYTLAEVLACVPPLSSREHRESDAIERMRDGWDHCAIEMKRHVEAL